MKFAHLDGPLPVQAMVRYNDHGSPALLQMLPPARMRVRFEVPKRAITPGQSVVCYQGDDLVAGGIIDEAAGRLP